MTNEQRDLFSYVLSRAATHFGYTETALMSQRRDADVALARMVVAYVMCTQYGWTLARTGFFLHRDHSTIHHAIARVEQLMRARAEVVRAVAHAAVPPVNIAAEIIETERYILAVDRLALAMQESARAGAEILTLVMRLTDDLRRVARTVNAILEEHSGLTAVELREMMETYEERRREALDAE